jgi:hypothetical protein
MYYLAPVIGFLIGVAGLGLGAAVGEPWSHPVMRSAMVFAFLLVIFLAVRARTVRCPVCGERFFGRYGGALTSTETIAYLHRRRFHCGATEKQPSRPGSP